MEGRKDRGFVAKTCNLPDTLRARVNFGRLSGQRARSNLNLPKVQIMTSHYDRVARRFHAVPVRFFLATLLSVLGTACSSSDASPASNNGHLGVDSGGPASGTRVTDTADLRRNGCSTRSAASAVCR